MSIIEAKELTFFYDKEKVVLDNLNLNIEKGSFTAIIGHNGSGKSTLINDILYPALKNELDRTSYHTFLHCLPLFRSPFLSVGTKYRQPRRHSRGEDLRPLALRPALSDGLPLTNISRFSLFLIFLGFAGVRMLLLFRLGRCREDQAVPRRCGSSAPVLLPAM